MIFTSPIDLMLASGIVLAMVVIGRIRRPALHWVSITAGLLGTMCLALAAGGISCRHTGELRIAVMVDCSPSTRGASFHDGQQLQARLSELLGDHTYLFYEFANQTRQATISEYLNEIPSDQTTFTPPPADAIVLFSDGQFDPPPVAPPIFAVIDPALDHPFDASIQNLEIHDESAVAQVANSGPARTVNWSNHSDAATTAPTGTTFLKTQPIAPSTPITARLSPGDHWPENDALTIQPSPPMASQRWWVGDQAPAGWQAISPPNLSTDPAAWLAPAIVVLNNISADSLSPPQLDRVRQYIRDLGGALLIIGGDHAFAAGNYAGSALESLSPLASSPPQPVMRWILLADSSGSMASLAGPQTRFQVAADAIVSAARSLPSDDLLTIGNFARELRWWSDGKPVKQTIELPLPPADVSPAGPTNLEAALRQIATSLPDSPPAELLVLTDTEAALTDPSAIANLLKRHRIRLDVLAIGQAPATGALAQIAHETGGQQLQQLDPTAWANLARQLLRAASPDRLIHAPISVTFDHDLASLPAINISLANQTWLKESATQLAAGKSDSQAFPLAARWNTGGGQVIAAAFAPTSTEIDSIAKLIARRPRDPRFAVNWQNGSKLNVRIDAQDNGQEMNGQKLSIQVGQFADQAIPQTGPGRYEIGLPSPRFSQIITLRHETQMLDRFAVAGRYPHEFDAIGNDRAALTDLANRTGGAVIEPWQHRPIEFHETQRIESIASVMAAIGAGLITMSLAWWRLKS